MGIDQMDQFSGIGNSARRIRFTWSRRLSVLAFGGIAALAVACGGAGEEASTATAIVDQASSNDAVVAAPEPTPSPTVEIVATTEPSPTAVPEIASVDDAAADESLPESDYSQLFSGDAESSRAERLRVIWRWNTDLSQRIIDLTELEILLPRDRIMPIDEPSFASVAEAPGYMDAKEPVVAVIVDGDARAYPLAILMWHEIVNDTVGDAPVTVTFCPLCNTGIVFSRLVDGDELTFGTSGMLRKSDLVMWDRETQSYWQQITGEALVGDYVASETVLDQLPSSIIAWETFADAYPDGQVLKRVFNEHGSPVRPYDTPPYAGYDDVDSQPFLFHETIDDRLVATSRVLTIDGVNPVAYPFSFLEASPVVNDSINGSEIVAFFDNGTFSAFVDTSNDRQTSGSVSVFSRLAADQVLTFEASETGIIDAETGSSWNLAGTAIDGELAGTQLEPVVHANHFWFAWAVFKPLTEIRKSLDDLTT